MATRRPRRQGSKAHPIRCRVFLGLYPAKGNLASALARRPVVGENHPLDFPVDHEFPLMRAVDLAFVQCIRCREPGIIAAVSTSSLILFMPLRSVAFVMIGPPFNRSALNGPVAERGAMVRKSEVFELLLHAQRSVTPGNRPSAQPGGTGSSPEFSCNVELFA